MTDHDSDSSSAEDVQTNVLLGFASKEPTSDDFSQLGGHPTWLDANSPPSAALAKCKVCNGYMNALLQLNGDLPDRFPGHERRLYIWACRRKTCRRKEGSVRGIRATRCSSAAPAASTTGGAPKEQKQQDAPAQQAKPAMNLGETLFGVKSPTNIPANPFASKSSASMPSNPFASASASSLAAKPAQNPTSTIDSLPETFAQKARIASPPPTQPPTQTPTHEPWPPVSAFPAPYLAYHIDADKEYIDASSPPSNTASTNLRIDDSNECGNAADDKSAFESTMDKTFQRFADRLSQNPEQILRYEFGGKPLLYSKTDAVGKLLSGGTDSKARVRAGGGIPRCGNCGAERVFELQITPHAIAELEAEEMSVEGMDWGTIVLAVCGRDCVERGKEVGKVGYVEEWVGVQWEEVGR